LIIFDIIYYTQSIGNVKPFQKKTQISRNDLPNTAVVVIAANVLGGEGRSRRAPHTPIGARGARVLCWMRGLQGGCPETPIRKIYARPFHRKAGRPRAFLLRFVPGLFLSGCAYVFRWGWKTYVMVPDGCEAVRAERAYSPAKASLHRGPRSPSFQCSRLRRSALH